MLRKLNKRKSRCRHRHPDPASVGGNRTIHVRLNGAEDDEAFDIAPGEIEQNRALGRVEVKGTAPALRAARVSPEKKRLMDGFLKGRHYEKIPGRGQQHDLAGERTFFERRPPRAQPRIDPHPEKPGTVRRTELIGRGDDSGQGPAGAEDRSGVPDLEERRLHAAEIELGRRRVGWNDEGACGVVEEWRGLITREVK